MNQRESLFFRLVLLAGMAMSVNVCAIGGDGLYLLRHAAEEKLRYLNAGLATETAGVWHGEVARHFGIEGKEITPEVFQNLIRGFSPDGKEKLTQNAGSAKRALGWEVVVAPHKSVSDLLAVLPPERWHEVISCHDDAVKEVIRCMEEYCGISRRGKGGKEQVAAGLIIGDHGHLTNRENEPLIHKHLTVMNAARGEDGKFGALVSQPLYAHQRLLNAIYHQTLARFLRERLGIVTELDRYGARVRGVPEAFIKATSTRSAQIAGAVGPHEMRSARAGDIAALTTRKDKDLKPVTVLASEWAKLANAFNFTWEMVMRREPRQLSKQQKDRLITRAIKNAARDLVSEAPVFERAQLLTRTITNLIGRCIDYREVSPMVDLVLGHPQVFDIVDLGKTKRTHGYTTREHLRLEERLVKHLTNLSHKYRPLVKLNRVEEVLRDYPQLLDEQAIAVRRLVVGPQVSILTGFAGTGKTTALKAFHEILNAPWRDRHTLRPPKVIGIATSGRAADTLQNDTGIPSMTVAKFLKDLRPTPHVDVFKAVLKKSFRSISDRLEYAKAVRRPKLSLDRRTIVVLDEASLVATKDFLLLAKRIDRSGARLVIVGDPAQMQAIGPAGALDHFLSRFRDRVSFLENIRRQEAAWERKAVREIVDGSAKEAIEAYAREKKLTVATDTQKAREAALQLYGKGGGVTAPKEHLLLANSNQDVRWLNHLAQAERLQAGLLEGKPLRMRGPTPNQGYDFYVHDRVLFHRNAVLSPPSKEPLAEALLRAAVDPLRKKLAEQLPDWASVFVNPKEPVRVRNGQFGTVLAVLPKLSRMLIQLDSGERVVVDAGRYPYLGLGYATSVFKAQSSTVNHVYALMGDRMTDRESAYVAASRGRLSTHLIMDGALRSPDHASAKETTNEQATAELIRQITKSHKQVAALEHQRLVKLEEREKVLAELKQIVPPPPPPPPPPPQQQPELGISR